MSEENEETKGAKSALDLRLEAAREKTRAASARFEESEDEAKLALVEAEEMKAEGMSAVADAVAKNGKKKVGVVRTYMGWIVLVRPNHIRWRKFQDDEIFTTESIGAMVHRCAVYPSAARREEIFEEIPQVVIQCGSVITELAAGRAQDLSGK